MKAIQFGVIYKKLPTLETLERMTFTAVTLAFLLLSIAILFGFIWLHRVYLEPELLRPQTHRHDHYVGNVWVPGNC